MATNGPEYVIMKKEDRDALVTFLAGLQIVPTSAPEAEAEDKAPAKKAK